jgi:hypothetical protein
MRFGVQVALILMTAAVPQLGAAAAEPDQSLTYDKPAEKWTEALPIGNGRIGAMVFGGPEDDRLQINDLACAHSGAFSYTRQGEQRDRLEINPPAELEDTRVTCSVDCSCRGVIGGGGVTGEDGVVHPRELRMVPGVEALCPELESNALMDTEVLV